MASKDGKSYFFVDFENVRSGFFSDENHVKKDDVVIFVYTKNGNKVSLDELKEITDKGAKIVYESVPAGDQSLDMHLSSILGYVIAKTGENGKNCNFCVISRDRDYDGVIDFWVETGYRVKRFAPVAKNAPTVSNVSQPKIQLPVGSKGKTAAHNIKLPKEIMDFVKKSQMPEMTAKEIVTRCKENSIKECNIVIMVETICKYANKKDRKAKTYQDMLHIFGQKTGVKYYRVVKDLI